MSQTIARPKPQPVSESDFNANMRNVRPQVCQMLHGEVTLIIANGKIALINVTNKFKPDELEQPTLRAA